MKDLKEKLEKCKHKNRACTNAMRGVERQAFYMGFDEASALHAPLIEALEDMSKPENFFKGNTLTWANLVMGPKATKALEAFTTKIDDGNMADKDAD